MQIEYIVDKSIFMDSTFDGVQQEISLKNYCRRHCGISMGLWRRIKWNGSVTVNGLPVRPTMASVKLGDRIMICLPETSPVQAVYHPLDIRYEDDYFLIVNKPANMLVHPTAGDYTGTLGNAVLYYYKQTGQNLSFHPVHRLDRNTTGLVLIAKLPHVQHKLTQDMVIAGQRAAGHGNMSPDERAHVLSSKKFFHRSYLAVISGELHPAAGVIHKPIARTPDSIITRYCPDDGTGQEAVTNYRTLLRSNGLSLLELQLKTGRTHQIRVHLSSMNHPILGDDLYGGNHQFISRQALHAYHMEVENPLTGECISVYADLPPDMQRLLTTEKNFFNL